MAKNQFNDKNLKFGEFMMDELGLYYNIEGIVCDQEDDTPLLVNGKNLIFPTSEYTVIDKRHQTLFDPLNNQSLGKYLFGFFIDHRLDSKIDNFHSMPDINDKNKGIIRVESNEQIIVETGSYYNDSVKYADAISQLNGTDTSSIGNYDAPLQKNKKGR